MGRRRSVDNLEEKYIDFLLTANKQASGKAFSRLFDGKIAHDQITRLLNTGEKFNATQLWKAVKPLCREAACEDNVLIFDDTLIEKPDTAENEMVMFHFDHSKHRFIKGLCLVTALYHTGLLDIPVSIGAVGKE